MAVALDLDRLLATAGVAGPELGPDELRQIWRVTGQSDDVLFDEFLEAITQTCRPTWEGRPLEPDELGLRVGHWKIDIAEHGVRAALLTALAAAVLIPHGFTEFTVGFVTAILPSVLDIERVELGAGDARLLLELRLKREIRNDFVTEDQLYETLPPETRAAINRYDFADFIERLREGGFAETRNGLIRIWPA
jgi:hypothetical protein